MGYLEYQPGAGWVAGVNGYKAHSGLNAAASNGYAIPIQIVQRLGILRKGFYHPMPQVVETTSRLLLDAPTEEPKK